jgi:hypothetical protein
VHRNDVHRVGVVAQALRHFAAIAPEHDAMADGVPKGVALKQCGREHMQRVEPAAGLRHVLNDEVPGNVASNSDLRSNG